MGETLVTELMGDAAARQGARRLAMTEFRPRRAPAALCAGLIVTAVAAMVSVEVITSAPVTGIGAALHRLTWQDPLVLSVSAVLATAGLGLIVFAAMPGRTRMEPLRGADPRLAGALSRAAMRRSLVLAAMGVPGITRAQVRLTGRIRRKVVVRAATHYRNPANMQELVRVAVGHRLGRIDPWRGRRVVVRLSWRKD